MNSARAHAYMPSAPRPSPNGHAANRAPARFRSAGRAEKRNSPHGLRMAAIDIGTNSLHMVIVEVTEQFSFKILSSEKELTDLGSTALVKHYLTQRAMNHTLEVLARYQRIARGLECDVVLAYATSAVRESANGGDFVEAAKSQLGLHIQVISAQEEARLIYLAVRQGIDLADDPVLIVDIGGGSAEFIVGTATKAPMLESRKLGASRLTQEFVHTDPISKGNLASLEKHIRKTLKPIITRVKELGARRVIGTSGTMENIVSMCLLQHGQENVRHRLLTEMTRDDFDLVYKQLRRLPLAERRSLPGLDPGRAGQIVAGAAVVNHVFDRLDINMIEVCDRAMREGMIIDYMQTHWPKVRLSVQIREPRRRSIVELGRRCNYDEMHHTQVCKLSLALFDGLQSIHGLTAAHRELLESAASAHDIGWHIGISGHHKHSYYLIKNGDLEGFSPLELELIANIARYHRKSPPKKSHEGYMSLDPPDRELVWKLASILRIADGLDRGHYGNVINLRTICRDRTVSILVETQADAELELWAARHKTDMFEQTYGRQVKFSAKVAKPPKSRNKRKQLRTTSR
jgi:exopolyphosphatase/guanosine-5'-triphosphate,3'-diphosphate pyrophosphatase